MSFDKQKWMPRLRVREPFLDLYHMLHDIQRGNIELSDISVNVLKVNDPDHELWHVMIHQLTEIANTLDAEE